MTDNLTNGIKISVPEATGAIAFTKKPFDYQSETSKWISDFMMGKILINEKGTAGKFDTLWTFYVKNTTGFQGDRISITMHRQIVYLYRSVMMIII